MTRKKTLKPSISPEARPVDKYRVVMELENVNMPTTFSRLFKDLNIHIPYLKAAISELLKAGDIKIFLTVNGYYYAKKGWSP